MSVVVAFVDTLCFLQYPWLASIDWVRILDADSVEIVLAPAVVAELDKKKNEGSPRLRQRARDALARIKEILDRGTLRGNLRPNVTISFVAKQPGIDFEAHGLSAGHADDRLIATVIEYTGAHPDARVVVVTDDTGLMLKSVARGLTVKEMPEDQRLPDEPDAEALENKRLKTALAEYENRLPRLRVVLNNGKAHCQFPLKPQVDALPDRIAARIDDLKKNYQPYKKAQVRPELALGVGSLFHMVSDAEIDRYNDALPKFFAATEKFLIASAKAEDLFRRSIELNLRVENYGTAPARDLLVLLHFPDGMVVTDEEHRPTEPKAPEPPTPPRSQMELLTSHSLVTGLLPFGGRFDLPDIPLKRNVSGPTIRRTNSFEVRFRIEKISQNLTARLGALYVLFDTWASARSFKIAWKIHTDSLPRQVEGCCHVVVGHESPVGK